MVGGFFLGLLTGWIGDYIQETYTTWQTSKEVACGLVAELDSNIEAVDVKKALAWVPEPRPADFTRKIVLSRVNDIRGGTYRLKRTRFIAHASVLKSLDKKVLAALLETYSGLESIEGAETVHLAAIQDENNAARTFQLLDELHDEYERTKTALKATAALMRAVCGPSR